MSGERIFIASNIGKEVQKGAINGEEGKIKIQKRSLTKRMCL